MHIEVGACARWLHRRLRAGYAPPPSSLPDVRCLTADGVIREGRAGPRIIAHRPAAEAGRDRLIAPDRLIALCPTYVASMSAAEHVERISALSRHFGEALRAAGEIDGTFVIGLQWSAGEEDEARARIAAMVRAAAPWGDVLGLTLRGPGKIRTINAAVAVFAASAIRGWVWLDDDVRLDPGALETLMTRFRARGWTGSVGAHSRPARGGRAASKAFARVKRVTSAVQQNPHACCMIVAADTVAGGVPDICIADDGFVFGKLLDPRHPDPLHAMEVVPGATCEFDAPTSVRGLLKNHHRLVYCHLTSIAGMPVESAKYYVTRMLFAGVRPRFGPDVRSSALGLVTSALKTGRVAWICAVAGYMMLRGAAGLPLTRIAWGAPPVASSEPARSGESL